MGSSALELSIVVRRQHYAYSVELAQGRDYGVWHLIPSGNRTTLSDLDGSAPATAQDTKDGSSNTAIGASKTNKCNIRIAPSARQSPAIKNALTSTRRLVLKDGFVKLSEPNETNPPHHLVTAYFIPFPNKSYDGLVTTIDDMNMLNWVYTDSGTYGVAYGVRVKAEQEITGPMGLTLMAEGAGSKITMDGWDGFMAVEDDEGDWSLYFDKDSDGLSGKLDESKVMQVAQVELHREMLE